MTKYKIELMRILTKPGITTKTPPVRVISSLEARNAINKLWEGFKIRKDELDEINKFWNDLNNALEYCQDWEDMFNYINLYNLYSDLEHKFKVFWQAYEELKEIYNDKVVAHKTKIKVNPHYGRHFSKYNTTQ